MMLGRGLVAVVCLAAVLLLCVFGLMWAVVDLSRQVSTENGALIDHKTGEVLATQNAGVEIFIERGSSGDNFENNRRALQDTCSAATFFGKGSLTKFENAWTQIQGGGSTQFSFNTNGAKETLDLATSHTQKTDLGNNAALYTGLKDPSTTPITHYHAYCGVPGQDADKCYFYETLTPKTVVSAVTPTSANFGLRTEFPATVKIVLASDSLFKVDVIESSEFMTGVDGDCTGNVVVSNLDPATRYYHKLIVNGVELDLDGKARSFQTYPIPTSTGPENDGFNFVVFADAANSKAKTQVKSYLNAGAEDSLFALQIGDFVS